MAEDEIQYEFKTVQAVRGTEARSIAKWQDDGWELVDQEQGRLRTKLEFRRPKPKVPWVPIAAAAGALALFAVFGGIASAVLGDDVETAAAEAPSQAADTASTEPSEPVAPVKPQADDPAANQVLTVENSQELAALLRGGQCDADVAQFATKYAGRTIQFDGSIQAMANHDDYDTRYDMLLGYGDEGPNTPDGAVFKYEDFNMYELNLTGPGAPDYIRVGDRFRFTAEVVEYNPNTCLLFLDLVATEAR